MRHFPGFVSLLLLLATPWGHAAPDRCSEPCRTLGECMYTDAGRCVAGFDEECEASEACARHGRCSAVDGVCSATSTEACEASAFCAERGECTLRDGHCEVTSDASCAQSAWCRDEGRCTHDDGACIVAAAADCARSTRCEEQGDCGLRGGQCAPATDAHCAESAACATEGRCELVDGTCAVPAEAADTGVSEPVDPDYPIQLDGPLRRRAARKVLRDVRAKALACGPLTAEVELTATILPDGKADDIAVFGVPRKQERCIAKALRKADAFPARKRPTQLRWRLHRPDPLDE